MTQCSFHAVRLWVSKQHWLNITNLLDIAWNCKSSPSWCALVCQLAATTVLFCNSHMSKTHLRHCSTSRRFLSLPKHSSATTWASAIGNVIFSKLLHFRRASRQLSNLTCRIGRHVGRRLCVWTFTRRVLRARVRVGVFCNKCSESIKVWHYICVTLIPNCMCSLCQHAEYGN